MAATEERIQLLKHESDRIIQYVKGLPAEALKQPSACAGWEGRDVIAHLTGGVDMFQMTISRGVLGESSPPEGFSPAGLDALQERLEANAHRSVALRESLGDNLLPTFAARCQNLNEILAGLGPADWDKLCYHPAVVIPVRTIIDLRITELTVHEWDIRSKLEGSAHLSADGLQANMELMPVFVVGRLFRPGGTTSGTVRYRFELMGAVPGRHDITIKNGTASMEAAGSAPADVTLRCDAETFVLLAYGRTTYQDAVDSGKMTVEGNQDLAAKFAP